MRTAIAALDGHSSSTGLFVPEQVVPEQFMHRARGGADMQPEKRLMLAVLETAVTDFFRGDIDDVLARRAELWMLSPERFWPFSCRNICEAVEIDWQALCEAIVRHRAGEHTMQRPERYQSGDRHRVK